MIEMIIIIRIILSLVIIEQVIPLANVNASGLGLSDFVEHPESVCISYGDGPEMKPVCD
jgi:hypothetical protein